MTVQVCVGSSCHLRGSHEIVERMQQAIEENGLQEQITLAGSFCTGLCNRSGVTVRVDDETYTGVTPESFRDFFREHILNPLKDGEKNHG